ncbi:MAG TPA: double-strand break repair helicase AddA [Caulobacteraceae bacterium]|nr:double-strand break repair helicase AddA [Caulobacteraceae bacterium]
MTSAIQTQVRASDPARSVFVTANAGSGKTSTLVSRVARLLLRGAAPEAILCVTYTKAAAAEMQRRLFEVLGDWAVAGDEELAAKLAALDEQPRDLARARQLFARALETPGGLKIQTIHAFCEKLLKRFPLEAGVSPGFQVLEDAAAAEVSAYARDAVAEAAIESPDGPIGKAYAHFAVELDWQRFNTMFTDFAARRAAIQAYVAASDADGGYGADIWFRCGFDARTEPETIEAEAVAGVDWVAWRDAAAVLANGSPNDQALAAAMVEAAAGQLFGPVWAAFCTVKGEPRKSLGTRSIDAGVRAWLADEQGRLGAARDRAKAARIARDTEYAVTLALTYAELYEGQKAAVGALDFGDLIGRTWELLKVRADAAWVLYKLDDGIDHILLDEAQDTAPEQWGILHALTDEFFAGTGRERRADRTVFAIGDEKQSIYSFQGARPERFQREAEAYRDQVIGARGDFIELPLEDNWRSTPEVLRFVDAVFAEPDLAAGLTPGRDAGRLRHRPLREAGFGAVEFWSLMESEPEEETDPWAPVDREPKESGGKKLARRIARSIRAMIDVRTAVFDKQAKALRPAVAGDFLILVRRRNPLFHEIIRALKREGVASGGADRLKLSEHIVFQDLVALGRFARFPGDDLTLAALLRSPFCDIDEDGLFDLAYRRGASSLWATLNARAAERPEWAKARDLLAWARGEAWSRPPFDFYSRALSRLDGDGRSMRARLLTRFGREAEDAIEAFLGEALGLEQRRVHDLERFLDEMVQTDLEVKREAEDQGGEVRVMTVHGAKGLEAPIVILPDTTTRARAQGGPLLESEDGFLWAPRKADDCPASAEARAAREEAADQESLRLLYVALTRARDRLIVAGVKTENQYYRGSWHDLAARGLERPEIDAETRVIEADGEDHDEGLRRLGADPLTAVALAGPAGPIAALPAWARRFAPLEPLVARYASPSNFVDAEKGPAPSPLAERDGLGRFRRGILIHRLLQLLPDLAAAARPKAAVSLLAREPDLTDSQRQEMAAAALGVLDDDRFAAVFGPGSRAEAAIAGGAKTLPPGLAVSGRIDRLLVEPGRVLVVDFKTNRPAPDRVEDADPAYLTQMAIYVAVLTEVFPGRAVEAAIVWTDGPKLMPIPEKIVRETLAGIGADS